MYKECELCEEEFALDGPYCSDCYIDILDGWEPVQVRRSHLVRMEREINRAIVNSIRKDKFARALVTIGAVSGFISLTLTIIGMVVLFND